MTIPWEFQKVLQLLSIQQGKTFNNFLKKNYFKQTNSQRVGWLLMHSLRVPFFNDPSAGSPTETLLRLLLPLNDQVCPTF